MLARSKWGPVVPVAVAAVLFPGLSYGQEAVPDQEISLESLMDMVVTATLREQSTADAPASIQVVTAADIKSRGYRTIKAVMNDVPGFNDVSDTNEEIVAVRGVYTSTTNKILTLVNGHRMNDLMLGRYNTDQFLGVEAIERIEFIRGPASALYGSGALVGIVNIITKKGADLSGTSVKVQGGPYGQEASASWGRQLVGYDVFFNFTYLDAVGQTIGQDETLDRPFPVAGAPARSTRTVGRHLRGSLPPEPQRYVHAQERELFAGPARGALSPGDAPGLERCPLQLRGRAAQAGLHRERHLRRLPVPPEFRQEQADLQPERALLLVLRAVVHHLGREPGRRAGYAQRHHGGVRQLSDEAHLRAAAAGRSELHRRRATL